MHRRIITLALAALAISAPAASAASDHARIVKLERRLATVTRQLQATQRIALNALSLDCLTAYSVTQFGANALNDGTTEGYLYTYPTTDPAAPPPTVVTTSLDVFRIGVDTGQYVWMLAAHDSCVDQTPGAGRIRAARGAAFAARRGAR